MSVSARAKGQLIRRNQNADIPAAYSRGQLRSSRPPKYKMNQNGNMSIIHCEFVSEIETDVLSINQTYKFALNPGIIGTFPWLSGIATRFESYRFKRIQAFYTPMVGTATSGYVAMGIDYDADDPAPASLTQLLQYKDANYDAPYRHFAVSSELVDRQTLSSQKYIRFGNVSGDIKTYDLGNLWVLLAPSVSGPIGAVEIEYEVELVTPALNLDALIQANSAKVLSSGSVSRSAPFGLTPNITGGLAIEAKQDISNSLTGISLNRSGQFIMESEGTGTVLNPAITPAMHILNPDGVEDTTGTWGSIVSAEWIVDTAATGAVLVVLYALNSPLAGISIDFNAVATTLTSMTSRVSPYLKSLA